MSNWPNRIVRMRKVGGAFDAGMKETAPGVDDGAGDSEGATWCSADDRSGREGPATGASGCSDARGGGVCSGPSFSSNGSQ